MHHARVDVTTDQLAEVAAALRVHFNVRLAIQEIFEVGTGANQAGHFVAVDTSGGRWGLKAAERGIPSGTEREILISELASLLEAPNASRAHLCTLAFRQHLRFAISSWMTGAKPLGDLDPAERNDLGRTGAGFSRQFGQWMAFGLLFSVHDRHAYNWVWTSGQLTMIDMEDCLRSPVSPAAYSVFRDLSIPWHDLDAELAEVQLGVTAMFDKWHDREAAVRHLLSHAQFNPAYPTTYAAASPDDVVREWTTVLGLRS